MKFLAINTAGAAVETALYMDGNITAQTDAAFKKASVVLFPFIDKLLSDAGVTLKELDFIGVVTGPGSFTGIRIGLTAARGFAQFASLPLVAVTYADVLSYNKSGTRLSAESLVTLSDAANGYVYVAAYSEKRALLLPPSVMTARQAGAFLALVDEPCLICADPACEKFAAAAGKSIAPFQADGSALVAAVLAAYGQSGTIPYEKVVPLYVRQSQAEERAVKP